MRAKKLYPGVMYDFACATKDMEKAKTCELARVMYDNVGTIQDVVTAK